MILTKEKTLHYLRTRINTISVRLPDGKLTPFPQDDLISVIQQDLAVGIGNEKRLSYISLKFHSRISHGLAKLRRRATITLSCEDSRTWIEETPGNYIPHDRHCEAFSIENKTEFR